MLSEIVSLILISAAGLFLYELHQIREEAERLKNENAEVSMEIGILLEAILKSMPEDQLNLADSVYNSLKAKIHQNPKS